jgi:WD40 repeat protein
LASQSQPSSVTPLPSQTSTPTPVLVTFGADSGGGLSFLHGSSFTGYELKASWPNSSILTLTDEFGIIWDYKWSPDGNFLALLVNKSRLQNKKLVVVDVENSLLVFETREDWNIESFGWAQDSANLVLSKRTDESATVYKLEVNNALVEQVNLNLSLQSITDFAWAPDGDQFAFVAYGEEGRALYLFDLDEGRTANLDVQGVARVFWLSDNKLLATTDTSIIEVDITTQENIELLNLNREAAVIQSPVVLSNDGTQIAFLVSEINQPTTEMPKASIRLFDLVGNESLSLTGPRSGIKSIAWSPSNNQLAFSECDESACDVNAITVDANSQETLLSDLAGEIVDIAWNEPIEVNQLLLPPTPTPLSPWEPFPTPALYDDFHAAEIDGAKWTVANPGSLQNFELAIEEDALKIATRGGVIGNLELRAGDFRPVQDIQVYEARLRVSRQGSSGFAFVAIQFGAGLQDYNWFTQCRLGNSVSVEVTFVCDVARDLGGYGIVFATEAIPAQFDQWYLARIEIDPELGALQYYLDGERIAMFVPEERQELISDKTGYLARIVEFSEGGQLVAFVDDVRISGEGVAAMGEVATSEPEVRETISPAEGVYLADLEPLGEPMVGWGVFSSKVFSVSSPNEGIYEGETIHSHGVIFTQGLAAHAESQITYSLNEFFTKLDATLSLYSESNQTTCGDGAIFQVKVDSHLVYESPVIYPTSELADVSVDLPEGDLLHLIVNSRGDNQCDFAIWGDPVLFR